MKVLTVSLCILAMFMGLVVWLLPISVDQSIAGLNVRLGLATSATYICLHVITVCLFLIGLRNFKETLRRPYIILCIGLIMLALAQIQLPLAILLDALWWITSGALIPLYIIPHILIYGGIRSFARLVGVKSHLSLFAVALPLTFVPVIISFLVPVQTSPAASTLLIAHFFLALSAWQLGISSISAYLVWHIKQSMGEAYKDAMHWLFLAMVAYAAVNIHFILLTYIGYETTWYGRNGTLAVFVVLGTLFVIAGYKFCQIGEREVMHKNASPIDVILYTASLATNQHEIDPLLDNLRILTSKMRPGQPLTPDDEKSLGSVYLELENYLILREQLRKITQQELRQRVMRKFRSDDQANSAFWSTIATQFVGPTPGQH